MRGCVNPIVNRSERPWLWVVKKGVGLPKLDNFVEKDGLGSFLN